MNGIRYVVTDGKQYLYSGEKGARLVDKIEDATIWDKKEECSKCYGCF